MALRQVELSLKKEKSDCGAQAKKRRRQVDDDLEKSLGIHELAKFTPT
jgi:hypothetical protein